MKRFTKRLSPSLIISLSFIAVILIGAILLFMPFTHKGKTGVSFINALFTSTSAVCVTGLVVVDTFDTFNALGQTIIAILIQIGGLGVTAVGTGVILVIGKKVNLSSRNLLKQSMNLDSAKGIISFIKSVFITTLSFEVLGAVLSFLVFIRDYPFFTAVGKSFFHSISSFNNAGFDNLGGFKNLLDYQNNVLLNFTTMFLIFFGGIGFLVIREIRDKKFKWKKFSMHTKVVLSVSVALILIGAILLRLTEDITFLGALFTSVSTRTAGFSTFSLSDFTIPGLILICVLMFIGASPGSTGGGIKTSTFFVLMAGVKAAAQNKDEQAFKYAIPKEAFRKAAIIFMLSLSTVLIGTYLILIVEKDMTFIAVLVEVISAFGTVGLSTGITPTLSLFSKILIIMIMFIGRLGPLTIATLWSFKRKDRIAFPEGNISIG